MSANGLNPSYDLSAFKFDSIKESIISREMTRHYMTDMITYTDTGVVVEEPQRSGRHNRAVCQPGGGAQLGGQLFSAMDPDPKPYTTSGRPARKSGQSTRTQNRIFIGNIYEKQLRNCN
ncbi:hypothetical protein ACFXTN_043110 [Malus domestica]